MEKFKLIATDLDWTLVYNRTQINEENLAYIKKYLEAKYDFVIVTGRPLFMCLPLIKKYGLEKYHNLYLICYNGSVFYSFKDKKSIDISEKINPCEIKELYNYTVLNKLNLLQYINNEVYLDQEFDYKDKKNSLDLLPIIKKEDFIKTNKTPLYKAIIASDYEILLSHIAKLRKLFPNLDFYFSQKYYLEVMPKGINKGSALEFLKTYLNIPFEKMIVLGDSENDSYMFEKVKTSFAMENSSLKVKEKASNILKSAEAPNFKYLIQKYFHID